MLLYPTYLTTCRCEEWEEVVVIVGCVSAGRLATLVSTVGHAAVNALLESLDVGSLLLFDV